MVIVWSLEDDTRQFNVKYPGAVTCIAMNDNLKQIVSGGYDGVKLWDSEKGKMLKQICTGINAAWNVAIDDTKVVVCVNRGLDTVMEVHPAG
jgi:hypothetical protein